MGVIQGIVPPHGGADGSRHATVDVARATLFLRTQSSWLRRGLERADDPVTLGVVLGTHDASHEAWVALIGVLRSSAHPAAPTAAALYGFHGRVVEFLERGAERRLDPGVAYGVCCLLTSRLRQLTRDAVDALERSGAQDAGASGARPA